MKYSIYADADSPVTMALGKDIAGHPVAVDLSKMPHLLVAGTTGSGKSVGLNAILVSLLYKKHPSQLKLVLIDPKKVELSLYRLIENHFLAAEMNELVALYSSLPVLQYPESWAHRCTEGIRSNIGIVLEAIICNNPYPAEQLSEAAWNQLVMKAFFTDKPIHKIIGLDQRANKELANMLWDYANERWAAFRTVNPQLWRCIGKFIDEKIFPGIQRIYNSPDTIERDAATLACYESDYPAAKELLNQNDSLKSQIESGKLSWDILAKKLMLPSF